MKGSTLLYFPLPPTLGKSHNLVSDRKVIENANAFSAEVAEKKDSITVG
jgi:hypothetical protein